MPARIPKIPKKVVPVVEEPSVTTSKKRKVSIKGQIWRRRNDE